MSRKASKKIFSKALMMRKNFNLIIFKANLDPNLISYLEEALYQ